MPSTSRFGLRYPSLTDAPDGTSLGEDLAQDADGWLSRAFPCTALTRPTGVGAGFLIYETDTESVAIYDGTDWTYVGAGSTSGGGVTGAEAQYSASSAQSVADSTNVVMAFGTDDTTSAAVTKSAQGAGHKFTLNTAGVWLITTTVRYATTTATGERFAGLKTAAGLELGGEGSAPTSGNPATVNFAINRRFAVGDAVYVTLFQGTGSTRTLEPFTGGGWCRINLSWLRG